MAALTTAAFFGWYRRSRRDPWVRLAEGDTAGDCWSALLDELARRGGSGGDSQVLPIGVRPVGRVEAAVHR